MNIRIIKDFKNVKSSRINEQEQTEIYSFNLFYQIQKERNHDPVFTSQRNHRRERSHVEDGQANGGDFDAM